MEIRSARLCDSEVAPLLAGLEEVYEQLYGPKLPDSDDVLAKWMMIKADEERLIRGANMHLPGRQVDPQQVRRDLWRLAEWERVRAGRAARKPSAAASAA